MVSVSPLKYAAAKFSAIPFISRPSSDKVSSESFFHHLIISIKLIIHRFRLVTISLLLYGCITELYIGIMPLSIVACIFLLSAPVQVMERFLSFIWNVIVDNLLSPIVFVALSSRNKYCIIISTSPTEDSLYFSAGRRVRNTKCRML